MPIPSGSVHICAPRSLAHGGDPIRELYAGFQGLMIPCARRGVQVRSKVVPIPKQAGRALVMMPYSRCFESSATDRAAQRVGQTGS